MGKIVMTGVDGNFGGYSANRILELVPAENLIFTSPSLGKIEKYKDSGAELREADFNNVESLRDAFSGGETLLLISMPFVGEKRRRAHKNAIDAAVACGVKKLIYTSIVGAGVEENDAYEIADHKYTEQYLCAQDIDYVILRDSQYAEAMVSAYEEAINNTNGVLSNNMGEGKMAFVSRNDCAEAAACVAAGAGEKNTIYFISGPEAMTIEKYLATANEVTGNTVTYNYITDEEMFGFFDSIGVPRETDGDWAESAKNFPFCSEGMVTFGKAIRLGQMDNCTNDFNMLTGKDPLTVKDMFENIQEHRIGERRSKD